jgi:AAA domain-containing protein
MTRHHIYRDASGVPVYKKTKGDDGKWRAAHPVGDIWVRCVKGQCEHDVPLYNLPEINDAVRDGAEIFLCEGERDADVLTGLGKVATTGPNGSDWKHTDALRGAAKVTIVRDFDHHGKGQQRAERVRAALAGAVKVVTVLSPPSGINDAAEAIEECGKVLGDFWVVPPETSLRRVLDAANAVESDIVRRSAHSYRVTCGHPEHADYNPSCDLDWSRDDVGEGRVLVKCRTCEATTAEIIAGWGLRLADLFDVRPGENPDDPKVSDAEDDADEYAGGWGPAGSDKVKILSGTFDPPRTKWFCRSDGVALLYAGRIHHVAAESESGKSLAFQVAALEVLAAGGRVLWLDFDDSELSVIGRLVQMGGDLLAVEERFDYRRPDAKPDKGPAARYFDALVDGGYDLVIFDGVTAAMNVWSLSGRVEDEYEKWVTGAPRRFARGGAAVVLIDHVVKSTDNRGRFAIGSQQKMNAVDGAHFTFDLHEPFRRGSRGHATIRVGKDRPGFIRQHAGEVRKADRTQPAAEFFITSSSGGAMTVRLDSPMDDVDRLMDDPAQHLDDKVREVVRRIEDMGLTEAVRRAPNQREALALLRKVGIRGDDAFLKPAVSYLRNEG